MIKIFESIPLLFTRPACATVCLIALSATPGVTFAEAWILKPSVSLATKVDDNFTLDDRTEREQEVATAKLGASLTLSRLTEAAETLGILRVDAIQYSGDVEDTPTQVGIRDKESVVAYFSTSHRTSPLTSWKLNVSVKEDTLLRSVSVFVDPEDTTIEPDDDVDDGLTRVAIDRRRIIFKPSFSTSLSERTRVNVRYRLNDVRHSNLQGEDIRDFRDHTLTGGYGYKYSPKDDLSLRLGLKQYATGDNEREYDSYSLTAGWKHRFTETTDMAIELGSRETEIETKSGNNSANSGVLLRVKGTKRTGLTRFQGRFGRQLFSSASGDLVQADEYVLNVTRKLSPLLGFSFKSRLFQNRLLRDNDADSDRADRRYITVRPSLTWNFAQWWKLVATYSYRREKRDGEPKSAESNSILVSVVYSQPTNLSSE